MNKLSLTILSDMTSTHQVDNFIELIIDRFELPQSLNGRITLSIIKAVHNYILYGNKRAPEKTITITAIKNHTKVIVTVENEGEGFDLSKIPDFSRTETFTQCTGRGLYLMITLPDELLFAKRGAKVIMTFSLNFN